MSIRDDGWKSYGRAVARLARERAGKEENDLPRCGLVEVVDPTGRKAGEDECGFLFTTVPFA